MYIAPEKSLQGIELITPQFMFIHDKYHQNNLHMNPDTLAKARESWQQLSDEDKSVYEKKANNQRKTIKKTFIKELQKWLKLTDIPKIKWNAKFLFIWKYVKDHSGEVPGKSQNWECELFDQAMQAWKELPTKQKKTYHREADSFTGKDMVDIRNYKELHPPSSEALTGKKEDPMQKMSDLKKILSTPKEGIFYKPAKGKKQVSVNEQDLRMEILTEREILPEKTNNNKKNKKKNKNKKNKNKKDKNKTLNKNKKNNKKNNKRNKNKTLNKNKSKNKSKKINKTSINKIVNKMSGTKKIKKKAIRKTQRLGPAKSKTISETLQWEKQRQIRQRRQAQEERARKVADLRQARARMAKPIPQNFEKSVILDKIKKGKFEATRVSKKPNPEKVYQYSGMYGNKHIWASLPTNSSNTQVKAKISPALLFRAGRAF